MSIILTAEPKVKCAESRKLLCRLVSCFWSVFSIMHPMASKSLSQSCGYLFAVESSVDSEAAIDGNPLSLVSGPHWHLWLECLAILLVSQRLHVALFLGRRAFRLREKVALTRLSKPNYFLSARIEDLNALCSFVLLAVYFCSQRALRLDRWESSRSVSTWLSDSVGNPQIVERIFWSRSFKTTVRRVSEGSVVQLDALACVEATSKSLSLWSWLAQSSSSIAIELAALHRLEHQGARTNLWLSHCRVQSSSDSRFFHQRVFYVERILLHFDRLIKHIV